MKSPLKYARRWHKEKYWWDCPKWEIQMDKFIKQRKNKFKGGYYVVDYKTAVND